MIYIWLLNVIKFWPNSEWDCRNPLPKASETHDQIPTFLSLWGEQNCAKWHQIADAQFFGATIVAPTVLLWIVSPSKTHLQRVIYQPVVKHSNGKYGSFNGKNHLSILIFARLDNKVGYPLIKHPSSPHPHLQWFCTATSADLPTKNQPHMPGSAQFQVDLYNL